MTFSLYRYINDDDSEAEESGSRGLLTDPLFSWAADMKSPEASVDFSDAKFVDKMLSVLFLRAGMWLEIETIDDVMSLAERRALWAKGKVTRVGNDQLKVTLELPGGKHTSAILRQFKFLTAVQVAQKKGEKLELNQLSGVINTVSDEVARTETVVYRDDDGVLWAVTCFTES